MKEPFLKRTFHTLIEAFENCLRRFPVTAGFTVALTIYLLYLVSTEAKGNEQHLLVAGYYLSMGMLLSLTMHLWSEELKNKTKGVFVQLVMHTLLLADAIYLYNLSSEQLHTEIAIAHAAGILALWLSVFFLSFIKEKNDIPSWNFAQNTIGIFVMANVTGLIMSGGISLLAFSLHQLFNVDVDEKCYLYILVICSLLLPMLLILGMLPQGEQKHNKEAQSSEFLKGVMHFLFLPLIAGYLIVLYVYAARILISWELPVGWVSWLVVALMVGCIVIEFGLYPVRIKEKKRLDEGIARWLPALALPMLVLMTVGIVRRFNDYGITINRLYIITLNAWFYIVCLGLVFTRARRINWIPISFSLLFLLTSVLPVNYASITRSVIRNDVERELAQSGDRNLPLSPAEYNDRLASMPKETAARVNDEFIYLSNWFGRKSVNDLVDEKTSFYSARQHYNTATDTDGTSGSASKESFINYNKQSSLQENIRIPDGYSQFTVLTESYDMMDRDIPYRYLETGTLPFALNSQTDGVNDTIYFEYKTIEALHLYEYNEMPPTLFKCNSDKSLFMLTRFSLNYNKTGKEDIRLSVNGYLFKK